jgi:hypothetical protein
MQLKNLIYEFIRFLGPIIPNIIYSNLLFLYNCLRLKKPYYWLNINRPRTLNEHICAIKFYERNPLAVEVADKIAVREFVNNLIGNQFLIPLITVFDSPEAIDFTKLPDKFVMKLNNGSGYNLICNDKNQIDQEAWKLTFKKAFERDFYISSREWHYREIKPKILVETFMGSNIKDYKFFCDKAKGPILVQLDVDRYFDHRRNIYDTNWNLLPVSYVYPNTKSTQARPKHFELMLNLSKTISTHFSFSRVDFYEIDDQVYFGEITLHPEGGAGPFDSFHSDYYIGQLFLK